MPEISYLEQSKIRVTSAPGNSPGVCVVCGAAHTGDRQYIDIGFDLDYYGTIYYCTFCFDEVARHVGYLSPKDASKLEEENNKLREQVLALTVKEQAIEQFISAARDSGLFDRINSPNYSGITISKADLEGSEPIISDDEITADGIIDDDQEPESSDNEQGPDRVSADGSDESKLNLDL